MMQHWAPPIRPFHVDLSVAANGDRSSSPSAFMQRRTLFRVGLASAAALTVVGGGWALWQPGFRAGHLGNGARQVFLAVGQTVLEGLLPPPGMPRNVALNDWLGRLEVTIASLPPATRAELSQLLGLLSLRPGRQWLAGLEPAWAEATAEQVQQALLDMRSSPRPLRQQAYHALRDLSMAAYFTSSQTWAQLGYPGPSDI